MMQTLVDALSDSSAPLGLRVAVASAVVVLGIAVLASTSRTQEDHTLDSEKKPLRKIHRLASPYPIIGDLIAYAQNIERLHDWLCEVSLQFKGEPWQSHILGKNPTITFTTPEACEDVLINQFDKFARGQFGNEALDGLFGQSIITYDGAHWYHQRKAAARFFTGKALRQCMMHTMRKNIAQMNEVIDANIADGGSFDLSNLISQFTLQTFTEVGLGVDLRWIGNDEPHPLHDAAEVGSPAIVRRLSMPRLLWKLEKFLGVGVEGQLTRTVKAMREWFQELIDQSLEVAERRQKQRQQHQQEKAGDISEVKSIVELFLEHGDDERDGLQSDNFIDFVITFVLAAQDTSAVTLMRFFLLVAEHPTVEARIRKEMHDVLGDVDGEYLSMDHVHRLVYLEATIKETLRLYPTVPTIQKEAVVDTVVCGDVHIRKGDSVCLHVYSMARNPNVWGPDAADFKPERWIDERTGTLKTFPLTKFASFSCGPRVCIGMKLGLLELHIVAANLLRRYNFKLAAPVDNGYIFAITLSLKAPLVMTAVHAKDLPIS